MSKVEGISVIFQQNNMKTREGQMVEEEGDKICFLSALNDDDDD